MNGMVWIANKHALLVHLPVAAALLIPVPILLAQRGGRGIRPWWTTCRYLAWMGLAGCLLATITGLFLGQTRGLLPAGAPWGPAGPGLPDLLRFHTILSAASILLGALCLRSLYRKRQEHQGIGLPAMFAGLAWSAVAFLAASSGYRLVGHGPARPLPPAPAPEAAVDPRPLPPPAASSPADPEASAPLRALDFASLQPMHPQPVKSPAHATAGSASG